MFPDIAVCRTMVCYPSLKIPNKPINFLGIYSGNVPLEHSITGDFVEIHVVAIHLIVKTFKLIPQTKNGVSQMKQFHAS